VWTKTKHGFAAKEKRMPEDSAKITPEIVKERAAIAGITLDEDRLDDIATMMEAALAPLRTLDLRAIRLVEPAVTFEASWDD
jgi:hypothetical protein